MIALYLKFRPYIGSIGRMGSALAGCLFNCRTGAVSSPPLEIKTRIGGTKLKLEPGVDIEDLTIRELLALAKCRGVDPVTLLPEGDPERVTTTREATS